MITERRNEIIDMVLEELKMLHTKRFFLYCCNIVDDEILGKNKITKDESIYIRDFFQKERPSDSEDCCAWYIGNKYEKRVKHLNYLKTLP